MEVLQVFPTTIGIHRREDDGLNLKLLTLIEQLRGGNTDDFFACPVNLCTLPLTEELETTFKFFCDSILATASVANNDFWSKDEVVPYLASCWVQQYEKGAFHSLHCHGGTSWSGVYMVDVDSDPTYAGDGNLQLMSPVSGANVSEIGDAYNEINKLDVEPVVGQIVVFPHYLKHQTLPYFGNKRRTVVAFNGGVKRRPTSVDE